jgi:hypothetical protein
MKKILFLASVVVFVSCNSGSEKPKVESMGTGADSAQLDNATYPYTADYSHNFEIGNTKNAQTLLQLYKDWDNNTLDNSKNSFADNDTMISADGSMFSGTRDSFFTVAKQMRSQMGTVVDSVHAWVPLRSKDKNEDWVLIWANEISTDSKGKKTSRQVHEVWRFNKEGKVDLVYQYAQAPPKVPSMSSNQKK